MNQKTCRHGITPLRDCQPCRRHSLDTADAKWRAKNPEKTKSLVRERVRRYRKRHPERVKASIKSWHARNPNWIKERSRKRTFARLRITAEDYADLLTYQGNRCAVCKSPEPHNGGSTWCIDHDHKTQQVRGILCAPCNRYLGHLEVHGLLDTAAQFQYYLQNPPARVVLKPTLALVKSA